MGFRQLLNRAAKAEPVESDEATPTPTRQKALPAREAIAPPIRGARLDKKAELVPEAVPPFSVANSKEGERRRPPAYVWRSQASRERRVEAMDFASTNF